jgi:hypothetical protein
MQRVRFEPIICLVLVVLTAAAFGRVLRNDFIDMDDDAYVTENDAVKAGLTTRGLWWDLTTFHAGYWHPLTWLSLQLDAHLFCRDGLSASGFHFTNLLWHTANVLLLFGVLRRMTGALWRSAFVAALFAVHPLHVESVAWVAERKDVLSTFFWILTLGAYTRYAAAPGLGRYLIVMAAFGLGLMAKPMLVTLPATLLLLDVWPLGRLGGEAGQRRWWPLIREKLPLFAQRAGGAVAQWQEFSFASRAANAALAYAAYLAKTVWPAGLAVFYPYPDPLPSARVALSVVALLSLTAFVLGAGRRRPYLVVGWLWYVGTLVPVIGLIKVGAQGMADRYTYVPLIGIFVAVTWGLSDLVRGRGAAERALSGAACLVVVALTVLTAMQAARWRVP